MTQPHPQPHPVDRNVGTNIRRLRRAAGLSQTELGRAIGVSFQQIQKYESGANRTSPSKLAGMAARLGLPIAAFFEGCVASDRSAAGRAPPERQAGRQAAAVVTE